MGDENLQIQTAPKPLAPKKKKKKKTESPNICRTWPNIKSPTPKYYIYIYIYIIYYIIKVKLKSRGCAKWLYQIA